VCTSRESNPCQKNDY